MVGSEFQEDHFGGDTEKEVNGGKQQLGKRIVLYLVQG